MHISQRVFFLPYFGVMKRAKQTFRIITNKYLIAVAVFVVMMLFFDDNNLFVQLDRKRQLNELFTQKEYYEKQIDTTNRQLSELQKSPESVEKFVREHYMMKRDNEDVFVVTLSVPVQEKNKP